MKSPRLGKIQKELLRWIEVYEYAMIGPGTTPPRWINLSGYSMDEVGPSLERLKSRGLIIEPKQGFYATPGWVRPETAQEVEEASQRVAKSIQAQEASHHQGNKTP